MKRHFQMLAFLLLGVSGILLLNGCGKPHGLTLRAFVDGTDMVKVSGNRLWIEHEDAQLPAQLFVNGKAWHPVWTGKTSEPLEDLSPAFHPRDSMKVKIVQLKGRGAVSIVQLPNSGNDQTLAFRIDDGPFGGADTYQISVAW
jgi:hypothetical protein